MPACQKDPSLTWRGHILLLRIYRAGDCSVHLLVIQTDYGAVVANPVAVGSHPRYAFTDLLGKHPIRRILRKEKRLDCDTEGLFKQGLSPSIRVSRLRERLGLPCSPFAKGRYGCAQLNCYAVLC